MPQNHPKLVTALRETAERLSNGAKYEWGHMGRCNCGHLVQTITQKSDREIVQTIDHQLDEWTEHAKDFCEGTGQKVEEIFGIMKKVGFGHEDFIHLEYLSDRRVLERIGGERKYLQKNTREDVILYMNTMADLLEEEMV